MCSKKEMRLIYLTNGKRYLIAKQQTLYKIFLYHMVGGGPGSLAKDAKIYAGDFPGWLYVERSMKNGHFSGFYSYILKTKIAELGFL